MSHLGNKIVLGLDEDQSPLALTPEQRAMHIWITGATGTGKSKTVESIVRQDLLRWSQSRCGVLLLDPDGKLFDDVMRFVADRDLRYLPIIPIDLRRSDFTISYNPLRKRAGISPAVAVAGLSDAIMHAWGQSDSTATPRLAKWLYATLMLLHNEGLTLIDALRLISDRKIRQCMVSRVEDVVARSVWYAASHLDESQFQTEVESMMNRLRRFLATNVMRAALCQPDVSLDLSNVVNKGSIVLVSLATAGGQISDEDAATFGSLLLTDLWSAALCRGKHDCVRPFYVFVDEFQRFMVPSMAESLDRARGYGLHFCLANQYPSQLELRGDAGQRVYHSVMANSRTKICFQLNHRKDLDDMALTLFRQVIDPNAVKSAIYSTKVLGHAIEYMPSYGESTSNGHSTTESESISESETLGTSTEWSHSDGTNESQTTGSSLSNGYSDSDTEGSGDTIGMTSSDGGSCSESEGTTDNHGIGRSHTTAVSYQLGSPDDEMRTGLVDGSCDPHQLPGDGETLGNKVRGVVVAESRGDAESETMVKSKSRAIAESHLDGVNTAHSRSIARQRGRNRGTSENSARSEGASANNTFGSSESQSITSGTTHGISETDSTSLSSSETWSPMFTPIMGKELSSLQFWSVEEQTFLRSQLIDALPARHCFVRVVGCPHPVKLRALQLDEPCIMPSWVEYWTKRALRQLPFALPLSDALSRLLERQRSLDVKLLGYSRISDDEPGSTRHPLK